MRPKLITQLDLTGRTCVERSVARLQEFEPPEGYYVCDSGGKDSVVIVALAKMAGVKHDVHHNVTTIDPPPVLRFLRRHHPDTEFHLPIRYRNFYEGLAVRGFPLRTRPGKGGRWCCEVFKHHGGQGRLKVFGLRQAERRASGKVRLTRLCADGTTNALNPIWDWSNGEVWSFIHSQNLPYCELYDQGWKRVGCVCCPYATLKERRRNEVRWPWMFHRLRRAFHELWNNRKKASNENLHIRFGSADDLFEWWMLAREPYPEVGTYWRAEK